jgi:hypothetical protein
MKRRGLLAAIGLVPLIGALLSGCVPVACEEAAAWPPGVWLDPTPWLAAHPGSTLTACLGSRCKTATSDTTSVLQLVVPPGAHSPNSSNASYTLTLSGSTGFHAHRDITLVKSSVSSPCGKQSWWQADARLESAGALSVWHSTPGPFPAAVHPAATPGSSVGLAVDTFGWRA